MQEKLLMRERKDGNHVAYLKKDERQTKKVVFLNHNLAKEIKQGDILG